MKKTYTSEPTDIILDDMPPEYDFDYRKARLNRFAMPVEEGRRVVVLDPDIAQVFTTSESVNALLRALLAAMPSVSAASAHPPARLPGDDTTKKHEGGGWAAPAPAA